MILYRSVSLQELELIYEGGMKAFPTRLPQQPIFYPVLQLEYARQIASDWNAKNGAFAGYVTQFKVDDEYISQFEKHAVGAPQGASQHEEFWIPAEEMEEFNRHIVGHIKVLEAHFGEGFQGFVPEKFALQGNNAVAQFTLLANSYIYRRMDFYLEIRRSHKAVFLNYPFWQKYEFKNQGLKEKVLQAIKEAWFSSFPKIPLPLPPPLDEDTPLIKQTDAQADSLADALHKNLAPVEQTDAQPDSPVNLVDEDAPPVEQSGAHPLVDPDHEELAPIQETPAPAHSLVNPLHEEPSLVQGTDADAHFAQGLALGLSGKYHEAIGELSKAVEDDPDDVAAHTSLGVAFHRLGEEVRALSCYETALRIDPTNAEAHYFRANILYSQGDVRGAIAGYTLAIGLKPELIEAHQKPVPRDRLTDYNAVPAQMHWIARPAYRILDLNRSLETVPRQAYLFKERAAEYYRLRNYAQAIADYNSSLELGPEDASVLHFRGLAYEQIGQFDRALEDYQRAIAMDPQLSDVYINRGVTLGKMGQFRQSIASLTEGIRLAPGNPDGYFNRGTSYFQQGDFENAIADFSNVIRLSPGDEAAYYWRGFAHEGAGRQREAIADYRQFLALSRDEQARKEIEGKLSQWNVGQSDRASRPHALPDEGQETDRVQSERPDQDRDLYGLLLALGERALRSTWFVSGLDCYGENAEELYAFADQNKPIDGRYLLHITSGIRQTIEGDFHAFDPGATAHWIFIRAWDGSGFYIETDDPEIKERLKTHFPQVEAVEGAAPPYEALFIASGQTSR